MRRDYLLAGKQCRPRAADMSGALKFLLGGDTSAHSVANDQNPRAGCRCVESGACDRRIIVGPRPKLGLDVARLSAGLLGPFRNTAIAAASEHRIGNLFRLSDRSKRS